MVPARIAILLKRLPFGGAERVLVDLAGAFAERVERVDFLLVQRQGGLVEQLSPRVNVIELGTVARPRLFPALARIARASGLRVRDLIAMKPPMAVRALPRLGDYMRRQRPDAILTTLPDNIMAALWARELVASDARVVIREANTFSQDTPAGGKSFDRLLPDLARRWYPRADAVIAVSEGVARDLARSLDLPAAHLTPIYNPVHQQRIDALARTPVDHPWFAEGTPPVAVSVGRLNPQKDLATLLRALADVRRTIDLRLLILGDGEERPALMELTRTLGLDGAVDMPGIDDNPYRFLARAEVFVLSSAWEGCPNVLLEALACGCPVVSTDCPSGPAEILESGRWGPLVPVGDAAALAGAIAATLAAPRPAAELRMRAADFSLDATADHYLSLLLPTAMTEGRAAALEVEPARVGSA